MVEYACKKCHRIINVKKCPYCQGEGSKNWKGIVIIIDPDKSEIAKKLNIESKGTYAMRVR